MLLEEEVLLGFPRTLHKCKLSCYPLSCWAQFCSVVCMMSMMLNSHGLVPWVQKVFSFFFLIPGGLRRGLPA